MQGLPLHVGKVPLVLLGASHWEGQMFVFFFRRVVKIDV